MDRRELLKGAAALTLTAQTMLGKTPERQSSSSPNASRPATRSASSPRRAASHPTRGNGRSRIREPRVQARGRRVCPRADGFSVGHRQGAAARPALGVRRPVDQGRLVCPRRRRCPANAARDRLRPDPQQSENTHRFFRYHGPASRDPSKLRPRHVPRAGRDFDQFRLQPHAGVERPDASVGAVQSGKFRRKCSRARRLFSNPR